MSADDADSPEWVARKTAWAHERKLLAARQACVPVIYKGLVEHVSGVHLHKDDSEAVIYLTGKHEPVRPCELSFQEPIV